MNCRLPCHQQVLRESDASDNRRAQCSEPRRVATALTTAVVARRLALCSAWALAWLLGCVPLPGAWAAEHALLIGVNEVAALPPRLRLRGPANDVALMRQALIARGVPAHHITVLAQRSPWAAAEPTHDAVRRAMERLATLAGPGDTVVLHLAGHGVQVPRPARHQQAQPEPDGLDEVFLLQDSGHWDATRAELPRVLRDDDIGAWIDTLVDRGARVLAVFDSCHAAGMARQPQAHARWRSVAGAELGVPLHAPAERRPPQAGPTAPAPRTDGRVLAYAARGHELAGEEWLPKDARASQARVQGVFSFEVAGALAAGANTAAELVAALRDRYASARRVSPSPLVVGQGPLMPP